MKEIPPLMFFTSPESVSPPNNRYFEYTKNTDDRVELIIKGLVLSTLFTKQRKITIYLIDNDKPLYDIIIKILNKNKNKIKTYDFYPELVLKKIEIEAIINKIRSSENEEKIHQFL